MCRLCEATDDEVRDIGRIFGYPECCIEEFISDNETISIKNEDVRNEAQITIARDTGGFVPCKMHAKMIFLGEITPEELVVERRDIKKSKKLNKLAHKH